MLQLDPDQTVFPNGACSEPVSSQIPPLLLYSGLALVGEAPGKDEARLNTPFVGRAGVLLNEMCQASGIDRASALVTNTFARRPVANKIAHFFCSQRKSLETLQRIDTSYGKHPTGYVRSEFSGDIERLFLILNATGTRVAVAFGATPLWALTGLSGVVRNVGLPVPDRTGHMLVVPTYHPAFLMRKRSADLNAESVEHLRLAASLLDQN